MKKYLLAAVLSTLAVPAYAACTITPIGPLQFYSNCSSDNQANDGDDLKMFVDKNLSNVQIIDGSLGKNDQAFQNVIATANAGFETDGSGFANFKSTNAGKPNNALTAYVFAANPLSTSLPDGTPYSGFDGQLFRGQVDNTGGYNGELFVLVTLKDGTVYSQTYTGIGDKNDFGVLGFDEQPGMEQLVRSVFISLNDPNETDAFGNNPLCIACGPVGGAWNEFKQIEFSVPGAIAAIPEPSTWAMMGAGFALMGLLGWRKRKVARYAV